MQTNTRELIVQKSPEEVYKFIKDPENYLSGMRNVEVSGRSATFSVPLFGSIEATITNLVENKKVVIYSDDINTSLVAELYKTEDNGTKICITSKSDPSCGLIANRLILNHIPDLLDSLVENLESQIV